MITSKDILKLDLQPNSVVFVDADAVDFQDLANNENWPEGTAGVPIIGVVLKIGQTVADAVLHLQREDAEEIFRTLIDRG